MKFYDNILLNKSKPIINWKKCIFYPKNEEKKFIKKHFKSAALWVIIIIKQKLKVTKTNCNTLKLNFGF